MSTACRVITGAPDRFPERQIEAFARLAAANGAQREGLLNRVRAARTLCFLVEDTALKGIAGIKSPHGPYHTLVFRSAGVPDLQTRYPIEFGWMYLAPDARARGNGEAMLRACMDAARGHNLYATSRTDNGAFAWLVARHGFRQLGRPYRSRHGDHELMLFGIEND